MVECMKNVKAFCNSIIEAPAVNVFYWDKKKNFGDKIGPFLVEQMSRQKTTNIFQRVEEKSGLLVVGSIIGMLDRPGLDIWGSGLIRPLSKNKVDELKKFPPRKILAVRGYKTYSQLRNKLGWDVPKILGDPALLLPNYFSANPEKSSTLGKVAIVPHYSHAALFAHLHSDESVKILNVEDEPLEVINDIATADICISTSLHGIIVAHAYGVPWVWLKITDNILRGDSFKFEDFFTVLDRKAVSEHELVKLQAKKTTSAELVKISQNATLPKNKFNFDELESSLKSYINEEKKELTFIQSACLRLGII